MEPDSEVCILVILRQGNFSEYRESSTAVLRIKAFFWETKWLIFSEFFLKPGAWEYIEKTRDMVHDLEKRVQAAKNNVESMSQLMTKWSEAPLYERKEGKKEGLLNLEVSKYLHLRLKWLKEC